MTEMIRVVMDKLNAVVGLEAILDGETIYVEDTDELGFTRSHDGNLGVAGFYREVLDEYEEILLEAYQDILDTAEIAEEKVDEAAEEPQEEPMLNVVESFLNSLGITQPADEPEGFAFAPPIKEHAPVSAQLDIAREYNSVKDIAEGLLNDDQDRGGIPSPEDYIREMKQEAAEMGTVATILKTEFRVSGVGYHTGKFLRSFADAEAAKGFARQCVAAAKSPTYAATVRIVPFTIHTPV